MKNERRQQIMIAMIMCVVTCLVMITATVAWYTSDKGAAKANGIELSVGAEKNIKVSITPGGEDIGTVSGNAAKIKIGLEELTNIVENQIAPGAFGKTTFYLTPLTESVVKYQIVPKIALLKGSEQPPEFLTMLNRHIQMFTDAAYTNVITEVNPAQGTLRWDSGNNIGIEEEITLYWKWYYEYPFTEEEIRTLTPEEKQQKKDAYDAEDTSIGKTVDKMQFRFEFTSGNR